MFIYIFEQTLWLKLSKFAIISAHDIKHIQILLKLRGKYEQLNFDLETVAYRIQVHQKLEMKR